MTKHACSVLGTVSLVLMSLPPPLFAQEAVTSSFDRVVLTLPDGETGDRIGATLLRRTASALMKRSGTFADLVESLTGFLDVTLTMHPSSLRGWLGHGHYRVIDGRIVGLMTVNPYPADAGLRARAIAHEVAHAFEIACLPRSSDTVGLRQMLADRTGRPASPSGTLETPFAQAIERAVGEEWRRSRPRRTQFAALAGRHGLDRCQPDAGVTQVASAQP